MTNPLPNLRVRTLTINSDDIYPRACLSRTPLNMFGHVPPHLSIKPYLDMTSFGHVLLLFIAMTHAGCGLKLCTVTINSDDIYPRGMFGQDPLENMH